MANLRVLPGRDVCRLLTDHGFVQVKQRGSHVLMQKAVAGITVTIPVPDHKELRVGALMSIIRQSGLPRALYE